MACVVTQLMQIVYGNIATFKSGGDDTSITRVRNGKVPIQFEVTRSTFLFSKLT